MKHMPGHGRADVDSHHALPVVRAPRETLEREDFAAFAALRDQPLGMTAHVVYEAIDPDLPGTLSPTVIAESIRGRIGFDGALMTDDLSMGALGAVAPDRDVGWRAETSLAAGCDLALHCNGDRAEMESVRARVPTLDGAARRRVTAALARRGHTEPFDVDAADQRGEALAEAGLP